MIEGGMRISLVKETRAKRQISWHGPHVESCPRSASMRAAAPMHRRDDRPGTKESTRSERDARKARLDDIDEMRREVRQAVAQHGGGHATLIPAPSEMRAEIPVFEPQPKALAGLSRRLKAAFDPYAILEPRRMWVEF
jgi:hypothetical protein